MTIFEVYHIKTGEIIFLNWFQYENLNLNNYILLSITNK